MPSNLHSPQSVNQALPRHSKLWLLDLGDLEADAGWFFSGANGSLASNRNPANERRKLKMISALIEHPRHGLFLYEVGSVPDAEQIWGEHLFDTFNRTTYLEEHRLDVAIARTGHDIRDIKGVIIGHLHIDHAGGLEFFRGTDVPIYVHEQELAAAYIGVATKRELGPYLPHILDFNFNWQTLNGPRIEILPGMTLYHTPGHTPGLMGLMVELRDHAPFLFTSDQFMFREHYEDGTPLGWLMRDTADWHRSREMIRCLAATHEPNLVFGHDPEVFLSFTEDFYT
ncbi:MAG: N-acyl homoserine lactonase family protein [Salinisphaera sp.]|nr:N-acyl homoserine lactonase family protein [Salinisphaera sp.]